MEQATDFLAECEALNDALLSVRDWDQATQFKGWTINDVMVHLHYWNVMADKSATDPDVFMVMIGKVMKNLGGGGLRPLENAEITLRGEDLRAAWIANARDMAARWGGYDPKMRVKWAGPDMSARSSITARQMETWAHGMEVFDLLGLTRKDTDRIKNVVVLGVNTFGWSHKVQGLSVPEQMPSLRLTAPSGEIWEWGDGPDLIEGPATDFAAVVTQTRAFADTALQTTGEDARRWMETAQCFAGPPETPPSPGARHIQ
ncbi:MAG: TIGR03084 family metal-binding protein [Pikeienuella sp.]